MEGFMTAVVKQQPKEGADIIKKEIPKIEPNEVLVKVKATSICGTDVHIYIWNEWAKSRIKPPKVMGHEFVGEVVEVGENVTSVNIGDLVSAETHIVCGKCRACRTGNGHICENTRILGVDTDGAFAEYIKVPEENVWINDKDIPLELLSIQEPLGNAVHTVFSGDVVGKSVAVVGCGPIGMMAIPLLKTTGASAIFAVEPSEYRMELAQKLGASKVINPIKEDVVKIIKSETEGYGADVVLDFSGSPTAIRQGLKYIAKGGRMSLLGLPDNEVPIDITNDIVFKGITI
ncbi:MAG: L-threonine 3-dehydrogenase, partial [Thermoanaerobacteraceae bacterium]